MVKIRSVSWLHIGNGKLLCVRSRGNDKFYIPGGKINNDESLEAALYREIQEELSIELTKSSIIPVVKITAEAHGYPSGTKVEMNCFTAQFQGEIVINSEIEELQWIGCNYKNLCAPAAQKAFEFLIVKGLLSL